MEKEKNIPAEEKNSEIEESESNITSDAGDFDGDDFNNDDFNGDDFDDGTEENDEYSEASYDSAEAEKEVKKASRKAEIYDKLQKVKKPAEIGLSAVFALLLAAYIACVVTLPTDTVAHNVYVEKLNLSGMTYDEALEAISQTPMFENQEITLTYGEQTFSMNGADIGLAANPDETAKKAFNYGKTGNTLKDAFTSFRLLFHKKSLVPAAQTDTGMLDAKINEFGVQIYGDLAKHTVELGDGKAIVHPGRTGYNGNPEQARTEIMDAMLNEQFKNIPVTLESASPENMTVEQFDGAVYKDPVDAYFIVENNEVQVIREETGRYIDKDEAAALLQTVTDGGPDVEIPYYTSYAEKTAEEIEANLFNGTMASYSTSYGGSTANRAANVARAAELINGTVVAPGEVFSFNDTVGERTVENGFSTAKEYVGGKSVDGIGGGTCQVSSTLYSAVLYASLEIVTRTNHMFTVSYIPNGQDATVSDSGVDFKFRNNSEYPIRIDANAGGGTITVSIIGTGWDPPRKVKIINTSSTTPAGVTNTTTVRYTYSPDGTLMGTHTLPSSRYNPYPTASST